MAKRQQQAQKRESKAQRPTPHKEEEREMKPSQALFRLSGNVARPEDIQTLQKVVGNRMIQRLLQSSGNMVQRNDGGDKPPPYSLLLDGKSAYDLIRNFAERDGKAFNIRLDKMNKAIEQFQTTILLSADKPPGDVLSVILLTLGQAVMDHFIEKHPLSLGIKTLVEVGKSLAAHSGDVKQAKGKDATRKFIQGFRDNVLQELINRKSDVEEDARDFYHKTFKKKGEKSWKPFKKGDTYVAGPQAAYLRYVDRETKRVKDESKALKQQSLEKMIYEKWVSGHTKKLPGTPLDSFAKEYFTGYLLIIFTSEFDWTGVGYAPNLPPKGIKSTKIDGAILKSPEAGKIVKRLKEFGSFNVWDIKVPKRVKIYEKTFNPLKESCAVELDADSNFVRKKDPWKLWDRGPYYRFPIPKNKLTKI